MSPRYSIRMSKKQPSINVRDLDKLESLQRLLKDKYQELKQITDGYSKFWSDLKAIDELILEHDEKGLLPQILKHEKTIAFLQSELHYGTPKEQTVEIMNELTVLRRLRTEMVTFCQQNFGGPWAERNKLWTNHKAACAREKHLKNEILKIEASLPKNPAKHSSDALMTDSDFLEWVKENTTPEEELLLELEAREHEAQWSEIELDRKDRMLQVAHQERKVWREYAKSFKNKMTEATDLQMEIDGKRIEWEQTKAKFDKAEQTYYTEKQKQEELAYLEVVKLNHVNERIDKINNQLTEIIPAGLFKFNVIVDPSETYDPAASADYIASLDGLSFSETTELNGLQSEMKIALKERQALIEEIKTKSEQGNKFALAQENLKYFQGMLEAISRDLEHLVAKRSAEINQALPVLPTSSTTDVNVKVEGVEAKGRVQEAKASVQFGFDVKADAQVITADQKKILDEIEAGRESIRKFEQIQLGGTSIDDMMQVVNFWESKQLTKFIPKEELRLNSNYDPFVKAVHALNEYGKDIVGQELEVRYAKGDKHFHSKAMLSFRLGIKPPPNPIIIRIVDRMLQTGNQVLCKFLVWNHAVKEYDEHYGIAMITLDRRQYYLETVGSVDSDLWEYWEENTKGVPPDVKSRRARWDEYIHWHNLVKANVNKTKNEKKGQRN